MPASRTSQSRMFHHQTHSSFQSTRQLSQQSSQLFQSLHELRLIEIIKNEQLKKLWIEINLVQHLKTIVVHDLENVYEEVLPRCPDFVQKQGLSAQQARRSLRTLRSDVPAEEPAGSSLIEAPPPLPLKKMKPKTSTTSSTPTSTTTTTTSTSPQPVYRWRLKPQDDSTPDSTTSLRIVRERQ